MSGSGIFRSTGELREYEEEAMGLSGKDQEVARAPPKPSPNWTKGLGRGPPLPSFSTSLLSPLLLVGLGKKESYSRWE